MKRLLTILFILISVSAFSQGGWLRPNTSYGTRSYRAAFDSTFFFPTGCGSPSLRLGTGGITANLNMSAIFYDSCGNKLWFYHPQAGGSWVEGGGGSIDSMIYVTVTRLHDSMTALTTRYHPLENQRLSTTNSVQFSDVLFAYPSVVGAQYITQVQASGVSTQDNTTGRVSLFDGNEMDFLLNTATGSYNRTHVNYEGITFSRGTGIGVFGTGLLTIAPLTIGQNRTWTLQDKTGTLALLSDIPSLAIPSKYVPFGNPTSTGLTSSNNFQYDDGVATAGTYTLSVGTSASSNIGRIILGGSGTGYGEVDFAGGPGKIGRAQEMDYITTPTGNGHRFYIDNNTLAVQIDGSSAAFKTFKSFIAGGSVYINKDSVDRLTSTTQDLLLLDTTGGINKVKRISASAISPSLQNLTNGFGINSFSYNGSSSQVVKVDTTQVPSKYYVDTFKTNVVRLTGVQTITGNKVFNSNIFMGDITNPGNAIKLNTVSGYGYVITSEPTNNNVTAMSADGIQFNTASLAQVLKLNPAPYSSSIFSYLPSGRNGQSSDTLVFQGDTLTTKGSNFVTQYQLLQRTGTFIQVPGTAFINSTDFSNSNWKDANGKAIRPIVNNRDVFYTSAQYDTLSGGGFRITIPGYSVSSTDTFFVFLPQAVSSQTITVNQTYSGFVALTDGATITMNAATTLNGEVTLGGNRTLSITNLQNGMGGQIWVRQDATGSRTLALPAGSIVIGGMGGILPLTRTPNAVDIVTWKYNSVSNKLVFGVGPNAN